jgi:Glycosyl hydrolases family 35
MAHGGTNFGFFSGANTDSNDESAYKPDLTSYDYVSIYPKFPVSNWTQLNFFFLQIRSLISLSQFPLFFIDYL